MQFTYWFIVIGVILISAVVLRPFAERARVNTTMLYLGFGVALGPVGAGMIVLDPVEGSWFMERLAEIAVIISLFSAGLKISLPWRSRRWLLAVRLAVGAMVLTVGLVGVIGVYVLGLSWAAAILLGAILAPTDPVLASDVTLADPNDRDKVRFALTGEAGLNDGTAFPFVMLGLGLLGLHDLGSFGWRWVAVDLIWASASGIAVGAAVGTAVGRLVIHMRAVRQEAFGLDELIALGLIALSYGLAVLIEGYGFLAVFAAALALRRFEQEHGGGVPPEEVRAAGASEPEAVTASTQAAPAYMTRAVLRFNEQTEHVGEFIVVLFVGALISVREPTLAMAAVAVLLFLVARPAAVQTALLGARASPWQRGLVSWFGIRGLGSVYYLSYAMQHGLPLELAETFTSTVLLVVTVSVVVHGLSVPPLMRRHGRRQKGNGAGR